MKLLLLFLYSFGASFLGVVPPGIINVNAAKVSVEQGVNRALFFTLGSCVIITIQAAIAIVIAQYLNLSVDELGALKKVGVVIFLGLAVYFFFLARANTSPKEIELSNKSGVVLKGMMFTILNVFPIPFYSFLCTSFSASKTFKLELPDVFVFILSIVLGSFTAILGYIVLFKRIKDTQDFNQKANYVLSVLTLVIAAYVLLDLYW